MCSYAPEFLVIENFSDDSPSRNTQKLKLLLQFSKLQKLIQNNSKTQVNAPPNKNKPQEFTNTLKASSLLFHRKIPCPMQVHSTAIMMLMTMLVELWQPGYQRLAVPCIHNMDCKTIRVVGWHNSCEHSAVAHRDESDATKGISSAIVHSTWHPLLVRHPHNLQYDEAIG